MTALEEYIADGGNHAYLPHTVSVRWEDAISVVDVPNGRHITIKVNGDYFKYFVQADSKSGLMFTIRDGEPFTSSVFRFIDNFNPRRS